MAFCPQNVEVCRQVLPLALLQPCQIVIISEANFLKVLSMLKEEVLVFLCVKDCHEPIFAFSCFFFCQLRFLAEDPTVNSAFASAVQTNTWPISRLVLLFNLWY